VSISRGGARLHECFLCAKGDKGGAGAIKMDATNRDSAVQTSKEDDVIIRWKGGEGTHQLRTIETGCPKKREGRG